MPCRRVSSSEMSSDWVMAPYGMSDFAGDAVEQLAGAYHADRAANVLRKMPFVAGDDILRTRNLGAMQKPAVVRIGQGGCRTFGPDELALAAQHRKQRADLVGLERKFRPRQHVGIFRKHGVREAGVHQPLMNGENDQRFVARRRKKARDQYIGIDNRPDHLIPGAAESFLRRCAAISALISSGVSASRPRRLAPVQAFCNQSGGGAAVRIKSCTLMITTAGSPRRSTTKRSLFRVVRSMICPNWVRAI